jgi:polyisoprenoid-binding protein YceI
MKSLKNVLLIATAFVFVCADSPTGNKYTLSQGYTVGIHGTSNLHDWDEKVQTVTGNSNITWNADGSFDLNTLNITMDVHSIKSTEGSIMNNNTYKALKADTYPNILFALIAPVKSISAGPKGQDITAKVYLTIAGATRAVDMTVSAIAQGHNVTFEGSKTILMTDFNIKPPVALFGTLKTGDEITIHFKGSFVMVNA